MSDVFIIECWSTDFDDNINILKMGGVWVKTKGIKDILLVPRTSVNM